MKILIVKTSAIGDVTHTLPSLNALKKKYPNAIINWLVEEAASDIVVGHPALNRVLISKRKTWISNLKKKNQRLKTIKEIYKFIKQLRDTKYDLVIDFQNLLKSGILVGLTKAKVKAGYGVGMEHSEYSYIFLNKKISAVNMDLHAIVRELLLIKALGVECDKVEFNFPITEDEKKQVEAILDYFKIDKKKPIICINPMTKWDTKLWYNEKFASLADKLIEKGANVFFTGSESDRKIIYEIFSNMKHKAHNLAGLTSLKVLAALYKRSDLVISTDTGPMHIAAAVDTPVVALFGPTAAYRTGPFGLKHKIIKVKLDCSPCLKKHCETKDCMNQITVENVLDGVYATSVLKK